MSHAVVADFEANTRRPTKNDLRLIVDCISAAGIEPIFTNKAEVIDVQFREQKLGYNKRIRVDQGKLRATISTRFAGQDFMCHIDLGAVIQHQKKYLRTNEEYAHEISRMQHVIFAAAERYAGTHIRDGEMILTLPMLTSRP